MKKNIKIKKYFRWALIISLLIFLAFIGYVLHETKDEIRAETDTIEDKLQSYYNENRMGGFAVSVFSEDSIYYSGGLGYADMDKRIEYTVETKQYIASISKTTIGISLLKAQELGLLNLDDPINMHLPFEVINPLHPTDHITIKHLATHTSSIDYNEELVESIYIDDSEKDPSLHDLIMDYFANADYGEVAFTKYKPGENWNYSNLAAGLAAYIIELKSGSSFDQFTQKHIFDPLQMNNTKWFQQDVDSTFLSNYYEPLENQSGIKEVKARGVKLYSNRDMITDVRDLTSFCQALIAHDSRLLSESSFRTLLEPQVKPSAMESNMDNHGIFFVIDRNQYGITYQLTGMTGGDNCINTMMLFDPRTKLGYIFIGNTGGSKLNRSNHIWIFRALVSLGDHILMSNAENSFIDRLNYKLYNLYSRVNGLF